MYELFGFELAGLQRALLCLCLAVLVYRYITVGRKYPLFGTRTKQATSVISAVWKKQVSPPVILGEYSEFDVTAPRSLEYWYSQRSKF
ncbi:hypothetical protein M8494_34590 (plasmid) [Serratia ureilytica]